MQARTRGLVAGLVALLFCPGPGLGNRDRPSNRVFNSFHGAVSVISRWTDEFQGNRPEFERELVLPDRLSVPQLDLQFDLKPPAIVDFKFRSITQDDTSFLFRYQDLRAYDLWLYYLESAWHQSGVARASSRKWLKGDFHLRRYSEHPVHLFWETIRFAGQGPNILRNHEFDRSGVSADLRTNFARLQLEVPHYQFRDRLDRRREVEELAYRAGFNKAWRDQFLSVRYQTHRGELPFFHEQYQFDDFLVDGQSLRIFGFNDLNARLKVNYRNRPRNVVRNFHHVNGLLGDLTISLVPLERSSVQIGISRKVVRTRRLNRRGIDEVDRVGVPSIAQLAAVSGIEENEPYGAEHWAKFFFNSWKKFSGHYRFGQTVTDKLPPTDVVEFGQTILLPHRAKTEEFRLSFTPNARFGVTGARQSETRVNLNRDMTTRYDYTDFYAYLVVWQRLTLSAGVSWWAHFTTRLVSDMLESVQSENFTASWDFGTGLSLFSDLRQLDYEGVRAAVEHVAETGVRISAGKQSGLDARISVTYDHLADRTTPDLSYRQVSLNVSAGAKF